MDLRSKLAIPDQKMAIYTYGEPRVGNSAFAKWIDQQQFPILRFVYEDDVIPHVPLKMWGYRHHNREIYQEKNVSYECQSNDQGEDKTCAASRFPTANMVSHLRAFDIVFGPWC
jgi:hypothetical protein